MEASRDVMKTHAKELTKEAVAAFKHSNQTFLLSFKTNESDRPESKQVREMLLDSSPHLKARLDEKVDSLTAVCRAFAESD